MIQPLPSGQVSGPFSSASREAEIVDAGPGGRVFGQRAVIVAAGVVHVPVHERGIDILLAEPLGKRDAI